MNDSSSNLIHAVRGPIMTIAVGALFALNQMTSYTIGRTWPALLILGGLLSLAGRVQPPKPERRPDFGGDK